MELGVGVYENGNSGCNAGMSRYFCQQDLEERLAPFSHDVDSICSGFG